MEKRLILSIVFLLFFGMTVSNAQPVFYSQKAEAWADSVLQKLELEEKLGQLFMVAAYSNRGIEHKEAISKLITEEHIGGLIFMQGGPVRQANLNNHYQGLSNIPLLVGMDAEWDLAMRLDSTFKFPWAMTAGAVQDSLLIYKMGYKMGEHAKRLGVHISFSPVMDINTNPKNPIINARSFGQDKERVTSHSLALMRGLQDAGVLACGKHFPGHGDTDADSHKTLPQVNHDVDRLKKVEMYPYKRLIDQGLGSIMVAHLDVPNLDSTGKPASLSKPIVTGVLQKDLEFDGLIITDALNMKGVSSKYAPGDVDLEAFKAGNDILLFAEDVPKAKERILQALAKEQIAETDLNARVKKILMAKYHLGLSKKQMVDTANLIEDLNDRTSEMLCKQLMENALTVLINKSHILPVKELKDVKIACVQMGDEIDKSFYDALQFYSKIDAYELGKDQNELLFKLSKYDLVLVGYHTDNKNPWKNYKPTKLQRSFLKKLSLQNEFILTLFANPYVLEFLPEAENAQGLIMAYQNNKEASMGAGQLIFGAISAKGTLPVSASSLFDVGYGQQSELLHRLGFAMPEEVGILNDKLQKIDSTAIAAIQAGATPGCQVLVAKNGKVFYQKNFGHHTYKKEHSVKDNSVYDVASITKIGATLPFIMKMYEEGKLDLDGTLGDVYPPAIGTNKENLVIRDILAHQSGLASWIPFYINSLENNQPNPALYSAKKEGGFEMQVTKDLYLSLSYQDSIYQTIFDSPINTSQGYKYSDLGYYFFKAIVEEEYRKPLDVLASENLYKPLGASTMGYHPLERIDKNNIPPTENDQYFRYERIQGTVHDQGAAMMNGVGGHAGLFSNSADLAKLMQMYLQGGKYGGVNYLDSATIAEFTRCQYCKNDNRRGAGFDKPQLSGPGPTCDCVSYLSFGHTGFTGTIAWADPQEDIVYIFLSNRTWPDAENRKLIRMNTRSLIQEYIYQSLNTYPEK